VILLGGVGWGEILGGLVELHATGKGFCGIRGNPYSRDEHRANAQSAIVLAREKLLSGDFDLLVLRRNP